MRARRALAPALVAFALLALARREACAQEASLRPDLEARVEVGYEGAFVDGTWTPVSVTLEIPAHAAALSGRVVLEPLPLERVAWFDAPFALPSSPTGSRTRVVLGAPTWGDRSFSVRVEDSLGRELAVVVPSSRHLDARDRLVLGTRPSGLGAFADAASRSGSPATGPVVQLARAVDGPDGELRDRFPVRAELLEALAAVILTDNPGVPELLREPERTGALEQWIRGGGALFVVGAGSPFWLGTPLEEWLPVTATGQRGGAPAWSLRFLGSLQAGTTVADCSVRESSALLEGTLSHPLVVERRIGAGRVVFLAFDPDAPELRGSLEAAHFLRGLVPAARDPLPIAPERLGRLATQTWDELSPLSIPGLAGVALAALTAAAIAGTGAARRRGRPDRVWVAPALSAGLAGVVVLVASLAREPSHTRSLAWVFVDPGGAGTIVEDVALAAGGAASFTVELLPGAMPVSHERPRTELVDFRARRAGLRFVPGAPLAVAPVDLVPKGVGTVLVSARGPVPGAPAARVRLEGLDLVVEARGSEPLPAGLACAVERATGRTLLVETPGMAAGSSARIRFDPSRDPAARVRDDEAAGPLWDRAPAAITNALLLRSLALLEPHVTQPAAIQGPFAWLALPGPAPSLTRAAERARGSSEDTPLRPVPTTSAHAIYLYPAAEGP